MSKTETLLGNNEIRMRRGQAAGAFALAFALALVLALVLALALALFGAAQSASSQPAYAQPASSQPAYAQSASSQPASAATTSTQPAPTATTLDEAAEDVVEFVYVDERYVAAGETNYIAFGLLDDLLDEDAQVASATLVIAPESGGDELMLEASALAGSAILFSPSFDADAELGLYVLDSMSYTLEGSDELHEVDLASGDEPYSFEVVSAATASLLESSETDDSGVMVISLGDDGELTASSSLAEALDAAADNTGTLSLSSIASIAQAGNFVVCIDAGHGGTDGGAQGYGLSEKNLNLKIAQYMRDELSQYQGVSVVMTRDSDVYVGLEERVQIAVRAGASLFVSIHNNSTGSGSASGAEVWVPNSSSYYYEATHVVGEELGNKIVSKLASLGLNNRGVKTRDYSPSGGASSTEYYADGSVADYYSVIRNSRYNGIPGIIVEHGFIDNASDAAFLSNDSNLRALGVADATAVAEQYGLSKQLQEEIAAPEGGTTVYRVYNPNSGLHHLSTSLEEVRYLQSLGWRTEGLSFFAGQATHAGDVAVYRVYNPNDGNHHWTKSEYEYRYLVSIGWNDEGIGWYESSSAITPVWRLYNPNSGEHHYTTSEYEYQSVQAAGWNAEGQAWNSL